MCDVSVILVCVCVCVSVCVWCVGGSPQEVSGEVPYHPGSCDNGVVSVL